jgi:hypothetical protein
MSRVDVIRVVDAAGDYRRKVSPAVAREMIANGDVEQVGPNDYYFLREFPRPSLFRKPAALNKHDMEVAAGLIGSCGEEFRERVKAWREVSP